MKQETFVNKYEAEWDDFENLLSHLDKSGKRARPDLELRDLPRGFRRLSKQLSLARTRHYSQDIVTRLNRLVLRAHQHYYKAKRLSLRGLMQLMVLNFPRAVRKEWRYFLVANALFYGPGIIIFLWSQIEPSIVYSLGIPVDVYEDMYAPDKDWNQRGDDSNFLMFGYYIYNNISIGFRTFGSGLLFCLGSIFFLVYNGVMLGAVFGHLYNVDSHISLFQFVIAHGSFELTAITLAGQAGLMLGVAVIRPGNQSRMLAIKQAAKRAMPIVYGMGIMLFIAAVVEAFWSPNPFPLHVKFGVGAILWCFVAAYLTFSGRQHAH